MLTVTLYTRQECHLCEQAKEDLEALQEIIPHRLVEVDIEQDTNKHIEKSKCHTNHTPVA